MVNQPRRNETLCLMRTPWRKWAPIECDIVQHHYWQNLWLVPKHQLAITAEEAPNNDLKSSIFILRLRIPLSICFQEILVFNLCIFFQWDDSPLRYIYFHSMIVICCLLHWYFERFAVISMIHDCRYCHAALVFGDKIGFFWKGGRILGF